MAKEHCVNLYVNMMNQLSSVKIMSQRDKTKMMNF